jgi:hypothetical protein
MCGRMPPTESDWIMASMPAASSAPLAMSASSWLDCCSLARKWLELWKVPKASAEDQKT